MSNNLPTESNDAVNAKEEWSGANKYNDKKIPVIDGVDSLAIRFHVHDSVKSYNVLTNDIKSFLRDVTRNESTKISIHSQQMAEADESELFYYEDGYRVRITELQ